MKLSRPKVLVAVALVGGNLLVWWWVDQRAERRHRDHEAAMRQELNRAAEHQRQAMEQWEIEQLVAPLRDVDEQSRQAAAKLERTAKWGLPESKSRRLAVRALVTALADESVEARGIATNTLYRINAAEVELAWPDRDNALSNPDAGIRALATITLGFGRGRASAIPQLTHALTDPSPEVRYWAARGLGELGPQAVSAAPDLTTLLADSDHKVWDAAAGALRKLGPGAVPSVIPALTHQKVETRRLAAQILWHFGPDAKEAVPHLIKALDDKDIRDNVVTALEAIRKPK